MAILQKIKKAGLVGRGGAEFSTALKWELVKKAKGKPKYVICNASEGEPGVFKDFFILDQYPEKIMEGMREALDFLGAKEAWFNINERYYKKLKNKLDHLIKIYAKKGYDFRIFKEDPSYIGGEETALLEAMEGERVQPRFKPPYPVEFGFLGKPTLINNVETFYDVALVAKGEYDGKRFYSVAGAVAKPGVYRFPNRSTLKEVLDESGNWPSFEFFAQVGGGASGLVLRDDQMAGHKVIGAGSVEIYPLKTKPRDLLLKWFKFYAEESCGKCTPCREGAYQLYQLVRHSKEVPWEDVLEIVEAMGRTSFCALGRSVLIPVKSYIRNVLNVEDPKHHVVCHL